MTLDALYLPRNQFDISDPKRASDPHIVNKRHLEIWAEQVTDSLSFVGCEAIRNTAQTLIATGVWTAIAFNAVTFDPDSLHSAGTITVKKAGWYHIIGVSSFANVAATTVGARVKVNGTIAKQKNEDGSANSDMATVEFYKLLSVGDAVTLESFQNSGGNASTEAASAELYPFLSVVRRTLA